MESITSQFETYCRSKPAGERYPYNRFCGCALYQFLTAAGLPVKYVSTDCWHDTDGAEHPLPLGLQRALADAPWTFSDLADRLSKAA